MAAEGNDFNINLGDTIYSDSEVGGAPVARTVSEKWGKYRLGLRLAGALGASRLGGPLQPLGRPRVHQRLLASGARRGDLRRRRQGVPRLLAGDVLAPHGALPHVPLGEAPRALLPRRALVPQREGDAGLRRRSRADRAPGRARRVRDARARASQSRLASLPRGDRRPVANDARRPPVRRVHEGDQGLEGDLEGRRQRGSDPAVLRAAIRPLGGVRGRARAAPASSCRPT